MLKSEEFHVEINSGRLINQILIAGNIICLEIEERSRTSHFLNPEFWSCIIAVNYVAARISVNRISLLFLCSFYGILFRLAVLLCLELKKIIYTLCNIRIIFSKHITGNIFKHFAEQLCSVRNLQRLDFLDFCLCKFYIMSYCALN